MGFDFQPPPKSLSILVSVGGVVTSVIEEKVTAIGCYESELNKAFMQLDAILFLSRFWAR